MFAAIERAWAAQGVELVDLKIGFGRDTAGALIVADMIDNDSWRLWLGGKKGCMLGKQVYRNMHEVTDAGLAQTLEGLGVPFEVKVVSAHRTPDLLFEYAGTAEVKTSNSTLNIQNCYSSPSVGSAPVCS